MVLHIGYLDPGAGSIILQAAVGGVLGGAYVCRRAIGKVISQGRGLVSRRRNRGASSDTNDS